MTEVKCVKIKDINEKELMYVTITNGNKRESINVGEKTWTRVNKLVNNETKKEETKNK